MYWWIIAITCICTALVIQYLCSSKILELKQVVSIKNMSLRDARFESERLEDQETELKNQQASLTHSMRRLRVDIKRLTDQLQEKGIDFPTPSFPLEDLEEELETPSA